MANGMYDQYGIDLASIDAARLNNQQTQQQNTLNQMALEEKQQAPKIAAIKAREDALNKSLAASAVYLLSKDGEEFNSTAQNIADYYRNQGVDLEQKFGPVQKWNKEGIVSQLVGPDMMKAIQAEEMKYKQKQTVGNKILSTPQMFDADPTTGRRSGWYYADESGKPVTFIRGISPADTTQKMAPEDLTLLRQTVKDLPKLKDEATKQKQNITTIDQALGLLKTGNVTGKGGQVRSFLQPYAEAMGVDTQGMNDAQTYQLLTRAITGPMRLDLIGSGPVSEYEQKLMKEMSGGGATGHAAAYTLLNYYKDLARNKINVYNQTLEGAASMQPDIKKIHKPISTENQAQPQSTQIPSGRVKVKSPSGQVGSIPASQLNDALSQGYVRVQ